MTAFRVAQEHQRALLLIVQDFDAPQHGRELAPAAEAKGIVSGVDSTISALKLSSGKCCDISLKLLHTRGTVAVLVRFTSSTQTVAESYRHRSRANLAKSYWRRSSER